MHDVSPALDVLGRLVTGFPKFWIAAGNLETKLILEDAPAVKAPVYICGLARSGSTVLLETLAVEPDAVTHRYQDFPFLFTPYWWNTVISFTPRRKFEKRERAHGDGIFVSPQSPEAMEEMLWMAFFPDLHGGKPENLSLPNPAFDRFYRQHIQKLLLARKATRYVSKGNYNVTRMAYLLNLFPDARFVVPVRAPQTHIVSLIRQHERFLEAGSQSARVARHFSQVGHFEFGPNRLPIHTGDEVRYRQIIAAWENGEEVRGWALYWDAIHRFVYNQLKNHPTLNKQVLIVRYEDLCDKPLEVLPHLFSHTGFVKTATELETLAETFRAPDYYPSPLTKSDMALISDITGKTAQAFGYEATGE